MRAHHPNALPPQVLPAAASSPASLCVRLLARPLVCCLTCGAVLPRPVTPAPRPVDDAIAIAAYDVEAFADLVCTDPARAAAQLAALSVSAQLRQALAYVAWLEQWGIVIGVDAVLAAWRALLAEHTPDTNGTAPVPRYTDVSHRVDGAGASPT